MIGNHNIVESQSAYNDNKFTNIPDDSQLNGDFYKRLVDLKQEQKKTLEFMKELYDQKQMLRNEIEKSEKNFNDLQISKNHTTYERNTMNAYGHVTDNHTHTYAHMHVDSDSESLHLTPRPQVFNYESEVLMDANSKQPNDVDATCDYFIDADEEDVNDSRKPADCEPDKSHERVLSDISDNLARIERMWDSFDLGVCDESNNRHRHRQQQPNVHQSQSFYEGQWNASKVTRPRPFTMTVRDEEKAQLKKKLQKEREEAERQRLDIELKESRKPFKATPAPDHVYRPLYEQLIEKEALRAKRLYLLGKEYLNKHVKPFNLTEPVLNQHSHSFSFDNSNDFARDTTQDFVANPLPEFYFNDDNITEKMKEEELYRQIRKQIRSNELLQKSKMPRNMALQKLKKELEVQRDLMLNTPNNARPPIGNRNAKKCFNVPNYDELYKRFMQEFEAKKAANQNMNAKAPRPFSFDKKITKKNPAKKPDASKPLSPDSQTELNITGRPQAANDSLTRLRRSVSASRNPLPFQLNESHRLRESANRKKLDELEITQARKEHVEKMKALRKQKLHDQIESKLKSPDPVRLNKSIDRKTRQLKLEKLKEQELFEAELDLINKKIESQKFLFERVDEENARKKAEKRFKEALKQAGLTENDIDVDLKIDKKIARPLSSKT